jgi:hypothetical protein
MVLRPLWEVRRKTGITTRCAGAVRRSRKVATGVIDKNVSVPYVAGEIPP